jgi:hypothetical protein
MMREYDTIMSLLNWPKELEDSQGDSRVRGGFKVMPIIMVIFRRKGHRGP